MRAIASLPHSVRSAGDGTGASETMADLGSVSFIVALPWVISPEGEGGSDGADDHLPRQPVIERRDGLDAGAVLRDDVVDFQLAEHVDDAGHALVGQPAEGEAAHPGVNLGHPRDA